MEKFPRPNPVADVPKRKVVKRLPDYLRPHEVPPLLASLKPKWKSLFATALYTGMRKGELFALQKSDVEKIRFRHVRTGQTRKPRNHSYPRPFERCHHPATTQKPTRFLPREPRPWWPRRPRNVT
jgi:integrase